MSQDKQQLQFNIQQSIASLLTCTDSNLLINYINNINSITTLNLNENELISLLQFIFNSTNSLLTTFRSMISTDHLLNVRIRMIECIHEFVEKYAAYMKNYLTQIVVTKTIKTNRNQTNKYFRCIYIYTYMIFDLIDKFVLFIIFV
jgi:hypothetical protein